MENNSLNDGSLFKYVVEPSAPGIAKHLRKMGIDCAYDKFMTDEYVMFLASTQNRILILKRAKNELLETVNRLQIRFHRSKLFRRCIKCNGIISPIDDKTKVQNDVPTEVYEENDYFAKCDNCHQIFWGTESGNPKQKHVWENACDFCRKYSFTDS
eukprot:gb/GECH01009032.1/.p1 GENE.gb/GECH01009032.1/~~gb/GECH01009032.1/.p1  ORF type:complete len:156 (+),score=40.15 gb/GECH01009032.1/:1-468(+)